MKTQKVSAIGQAAEKAGTTKSKLRRLDEVLKPIRLNERGDRAYTDQMIKIAAAVTDRSK